MSLVHKYRPKNLATIIGQTSVVKSLQGAIKQNRIHSAYLFAGSRGTGKTSTARVLAKSLNCEKGVTLDPCGECHSCKTIEGGTSIDVFEIDAASNNGVDFARDLTKGTSLVSMGGRYKIYIIDECHNLTRQANEALLKTIEEPGSKTIFVFCTTEPTKVLKTIESRCQVFKFKPVDEEVIFKHLTTITHEELLEVSPDLITAISQLCEGVVRDAVTMLDQVSLNPEATIEDLYDMVGKMPSNHILQLLDAVASQASINIYSALKETFKSGIDPLQLLGEMANFCRNALVAKQDPMAFKIMTCDTQTFKSAGQWAKQIDESKLVDLVIFLRKCEIDFSAAKIPKLFVEACLLEMMQLVDKKKASIADNSHYYIPPVQAKTVTPDQTVTMSSIATKTEIEVFDFASIWQKMISLDCMAKLTPAVVKYQFVQKENRLVVWLQEKYKALPKAVDTAIMRLVEAATEVELTVDEVKILFDEDTVN